MSEAMALERLTQALAELEGYLTAVRVPYLPRIDGRGNEKTQGQMGDLDVVGIGPDPDRRLMVAECKGHGGPESYGRWLVPSYLHYLQDVVWGPASNIQWVAAPRWEQEFTAHNHKPHEIWVTVSGDFVPRSSPSSWTFEDDDYADFKRAMQKHAQPLWDRRKGMSKAEMDNELVSYAESLLGEPYDIKVRLLPVHKLISRLIKAVGEDMMVRRRRYPDTALELIRWLFRAVHAETLDLSTIESAIRKLPVLDSGEG